MKLRVGSLKGQVVTTARPNSQKQKQTKKENSNNYIVNERVEITTNTYLLPSYRTWMR